MNLGPIVVSLAFLSILSGGSAAACLQEVSGSAEWLGRLNATNPNGVQSGDVPGAESFVALRGKAEVEIGKASLSGNFRTYGILAGDRRNALRFDEAFASLQIPGERHRAIAPLYGADLLGGCLGSLSGSLLLIPFAGLDLSAFLMAPLSVLALTLTMRVWAGPRDS